LFHFSADIYHTMSEYFHLSLKRTKMMSIRIRQFQTAQKTSLFQKVTILFSALYLWFENRPANI